MNNENLISLNKRTQRERKEIARKGAIATNKKKAEQKTYRELAKAMLSANITDQKILDELKAYGIEETDIKAYTLLGMIKASAQGSHNAFDRLLELAGEKDTPPDQNRFNEGMQALANLINNPASNRSITDFEDNDND